MSARRTDHPTRDQVNGATVTRGGVPGGEGTGLSGAQGRRAGLCGPRCTPLHPDGFRPPQLLLPRLIELSYDLLRLLEGETEQSEAEGKRARGETKPQAEGRRASLRGTETPDPQSVLAARCLEDQGLEALCTFKTTCFLWTYPEKGRERQSEPGGREAGTWGRRAGPATQTSMDTSPFPPAPPQVDPHAPTLQGPPPCPAPPQPQVWPLCL